MGSFFTGRYRRSIDSKNRVVFPAEVLVAMAPEDRDGIFLIPEAQCVLLWPRSFLFDFAERRRGEDIDRRAFNRALYSRALFRQFDKSGRIVLPGEIRGRFPGNEVLIAGVGHTLEAWDPDAFESQDTELKL